MAYSAVQAWTRYKLNFKVFADRKDFVKQGLDAANDIDSKGQFTNSSGNPRSFSDYIDVNHLRRMAKVNVYAKQWELEKYMKMFDELTATIDMGGAFKKTRLEITDDSRGIFSFGLASKGLFRVPEYFSEQLAIESPTEFQNKIPGVVPTDLVISKKGIFKTTFWYKQPVTKKEYELRQQQEGLAKILLADPNTPTEVKNGMLTVSGKQKGLSFATKNKKSYVMFEKKGGKAKMVELYIPIHGSIYLPNIVPLLLVARFLRLYGIMTRISVIRVYEENSREFLGWGYPIKDYGDEFDFNLMALQGGYVDDQWWHAVAVVVRAMNNQRLAAGKKFSSILWDGTGSSPGDVGSSRGTTERQGYTELFSRYRNWYMEEIEAGRLPPLRVDKKLMLFGGNMRGNSEQDIITEFYRILDTVDFQFNKPEDTCKRIYKRLVDDKLDEAYQKNYVEFTLGASKTTTLIKDAPPNVRDTEMANLKAKYKTAYKTYVVELLIDTYTYPIGGEYPEPKESAEKLEIELDEKLDAVNLFLKTV